ncbi:hypothetical protein SteCoe_32098 [Stentor coeruleus]|uniref:SH3 domain-containing protein n=1 Tax=Stentor coeruleus TaxID=5963 RepID=A0A1R2B001_9CILI|nr:hypothetical protein SteCoe_32098 [Stentor coeruleus]
MEKRKVLSKGRLIKNKPDLNKSTLETLHTDSLIKLTKSNLVQDTSKKSITPTPSRNVKTKTILSKRTSDTPKPKPEDLESKRKITQGSQDNLETYYTNYIKTLTAKLDKYKSHNEEMESDLKQMEISFKLEENNLKKEVEKLSLEVKKVKKEKAQQEMDLMEENFKLRRNHEEFKSAVQQLLVEISAVFIGFESKSSEDLGKDASEVLKKINDMQMMQEEPQVTRLSLKDTASFSSAINESTSIVENEKVDYGKDYEDDQRNTFKEAIVLHSHSPKNEEELRLIPGDRVVVFDSDEERLWWTGKVGERFGKFPRGCVMLD